MNKKIFALSLVFAFLAAPCWAQDYGSQDQGQGVYSYRGFPIYPPGRSYSYEREYVSSFTLHLFSDDELQSTAPDDIAKRKDAVAYAASYIEKKAVGLGWKLAQKKEDPDAGNYSLIFTKDFESGAQQAQVTLGADGSISYSFTALP